MGCNLNPVPAVAAKDKEMGGPVVSVILPTFNRANMVVDALSSVGAQSYPEWEIIVVDDGSTDATEQAVRGFGRTVDRPVRYVYQQNSGVASARNTGLDQATGELFAFLDSDDLWLPHHLERCVAALRRHEDVDWVYGASRVVA